MRRSPSVLAPSTWPLACLPISLAVLGGCGFDAGHDYSVTSTWLLNGATPDATRCDELGISSFRLTMDGPGPNRTLEADCTETIRISDAVYGGFETPVWFDYGVRYAYTVEALDANGKKVLYDYGNDVLVYYGDFVPRDLDTVDVFAPEGQVASFSAEWIFSSGDLASDCATNKVKQVAIWVASATDPDFIDPVVLATSACEDGVFTSDGKILARGDYYFMYVALDARGAIAEASPALAEFVDGPRDVALARYQFKGL